MTLADDLRWFMSGLDPAPQRIHVHPENEMWSDESGGSALGTPADHYTFRRWLTSPTATQRERDERSCTICVGHGKDQRGKECIGCGGRGFWVAIAPPVYRTPMRAALAAIAHRRVPNGYPPLDTTLRALAMCRGGLHETAFLLAGQWPAVAEVAACTRHVAEALRAARQEWRDEPRARALRGQKSEAQLDAEAEGRTAA